MFVMPFEEFSPYVLSTFLIQSKEVLLQPYILFNSKK